MSVNFWDYFTPEVGGSWEMYQHDLMDYIRENGWDEKMADCTRAALEEGSPIACYYSLALRRYFGIEDRFIGEYIRTGCSEIDEDIRESEVNIIINAGGLTDLADLAALEVKTNPQHTRAAVFRAIKDLEEADEFFEYDESSERKSLKRFCDKLENFNIDVQEIFIKDAKSVTAIDRTKGYEDLCFLAKYLPNPDKIYGAEMLKVLESKITIQTEVGEIKGLEDEDIDAFKEICKERGISLVNPLAEKMKEMGKKGETPVKPENPTSKIKK